ncbi:hypothetical protein [Alicyclobacillus sp. SO9]|nr:hypothetical protein [Alicyclobacillus sp. SO9]
MTGVTAKEVTAKEVTAKEVTAKEVTAKEVRIDATYRHERRKNAV